ncbi:MAG: Ig-like domain-containing protein, partial [Isosphaeraceae bacterium]|nr:Ig-like domain-containing protein [Isosphaeraceae bacterium]
MMEFRFGQDGSRKSGQPVRCRRTRKPGVEGLEDRRLLSGLINEYPVPTASTSPVSIASGPNGDLWYVERDSSTIGQITPTGTVSTFAIPTAASAPTSITAGPSGEGGLWFTESAGNKIGRIDSASDKVTEYALPTANSKPTGITVGPDGDLWFTENGSNKIGRITPSGTITEFSIPTANSQPTSITAGPNGNLWFTETGANKIGEITPTGTVTEFSTGLTAGSGLGSITSGPNGNLWFTETGANKIGEITPTGAVTEFSSGLTAASAPTAIVTGPNGNLWFTENAADKVAEITTSGAVTEFNLPTLQSAPVGIATGPDGNLWVTEQAADKITRVTTAGPATEFVAQTATSDPYGITLGPVSDGALWFTEQSLGTTSVGRMTTAGASTLYNLPPDSYPQSITLGPDGALWYTDTGVNRIGRVTTTGGIVTYNLTALPGGITTGPDGNLWFTLQAMGSGSDEIGRITPTGVITTYNIPTANGGPARIAAGANGNLWFTENFSGKIGEINPNTDQMTEFNLPTANSGPLGIVKGPDGNMWFTEEGADKIGKISPSGTVTEYPIPTPNSNPSGITVGSDGNLWFTESAGSANHIAEINPTTGAIREFPVPTAGSAPNNITNGPDNNLWFTEFGANQIGQLVLSAIPAPTAPKLASADDTGVSNGDGITQNNGTTGAPLTYTLSNVSPSNGYAWLYNDTNPSDPTLLAGPVQAVNGTATFTIAGAQPLADGTYQIAATTSATAGGAQSGMSGTTSLAIETSLQVTGVSPATNFTTTLPNGQVVVTFNHDLAGLTPDVANGGAFTSSPFAVMLIPSGPDGGALNAAHAASLWTAPSGVDSGDLPVPATLVYHQNADGTSQITLTPALPLSTDIYLISVNGLTDLAGNPLSGAGGRGTAYYTSFDYHASPVNSAALAVTGVTANQGAVVINNNAIPQPDTIGIAFNKALSPWTVNGSSVHLYRQTGPGTAAPVQAAVAYSPTTQTVYLTPEETLTPGTVYDVKVDSTVSDDQNFPSTGATLAQPFTTSFTVSGAAVTSSSPLTVTQTSPANGTKDSQPLGYGAVTFSEGVNLQSLSRFSAMLVPHSGGVTTGGSGYADVPVNAKLAFNPNTNQLIVVPTQPLADSIYLFSLSGIKATNGDALTNPGGGSTVYSTFQLASGALPAVKLPSVTPA